MIHQKLWLVNRLKREIIWHFGASGTMEHIVGNGLRAVPEDFDANGAKSTILEFAGHASDSEVPAAERHGGRSLQGKKWGDRGCDRPTACYAKQVCSV